MQSMVLSEKSFHDSPPAEMLSVGGRTLDAVPLVSDDKDLEIHSLSLLNKLRKIAEEILPADRFNRLDFTEHRRIFSTRQNTALPADVRRVLQALAQFIWELEKSEHPALQENALEEIIPKMSAPLEKIVPIFSDPTLKLMRRGVEPDPVGVLGIVRYRLLLTFAGQYCQKKGIARYNMACVILMLRQGASNAGLNIFPFSPDIPYPQNERIQTTSVSPEVVKIFLEFFVKRYTCNTALQACVGALDEYITMQCRKIMNRPASAEAATYYQKLVCLLQDWNIKPESVLNIQHNNVAELIEISRKPEVIGILHEHCKQQLLHQGYFLPSNVLTAGATDLPECKEEVSIVPTELGLTPVSIRSPVHRERVWKAHRKNGGGWNWNQSLLLNTFGGSVPFWVWRTTYTLSKIQDGQPNALQEIHNTLLQVSPLLMQSITKMYALAHNHVLSVLMILISMTSGRQYLEGKGKHYIRQAHLRTFPEGQAFLAHLDRMQKPDAEELPFPQLADQPAEPAGQKRKPSPPADSQENTKRPRFFYPTNDHPRPPPLVRPATQQPVAAPPR